MIDYFDLIWNETKPCFLLDYDKSLNKPINIKSLVHRINAGESSPVFKFEDEDSNYPSIIYSKHSLRYTLTKAVLSRMVKDIEELKILWNTQSLMYDYEKDPYLKIYGMYKVSNNIIYNLGLTTIWDKSGGKAVSPITLNKAMSASSQTDFLSIQTASEKDDDTFNFSKFLEGRKEC